MDGSIRLGGRFGFSVGQEDEKSLEICLMILYQPAAIELIRAFLTTIAHKSDRPKKGILEKGSKFQDKPISKVPRRRLYQECLLENAWHDKITRKRLF